MARERSRESRIQRACPDFAQGVQDYCAHPDRLRMHRQGAFLYAAQWRWCGQVTGYKRDNVTQDFIFTGLPNPAYPAWRASLTTVDKVF